MLVPPESIPHQRNCAGRTKPTAFVDGSGLITAPRVRALSALRPRLLGSHAEHISPAHRQGCGTVYH